jgi:hypothetical protein
MLVIMLTPGGISDLNGLSVLPSIRERIYCRCDDVGTVLFPLLSVDTETLIARLGHARISLTIGCKSRHELRDTEGQLLVKISVPGVPGLPVCMSQPRGEENQWSG